MLSKTETFLDKQYKMPEDLQKSYSRTGKPHEYYNGNTPVRKPEKQLLSSQVVQCYTWHKWGALVVIWQWLQQKLAIKRHRINAFLLWRYSCKADYFPLGGFLHWCKLMIHTLDQNRHCFLNFILQTDWNRLNNCKMNNRINNKVNSCKKLQASLQQLDKPSLTNWE